MTSCIVFLNCIIIILICNFILDFSNYILELSNIDVTYFNGDFYNFNLLICFNNDFNSKNAKNINYNLSRRKIKKIEYADFQYRFRKNLL